MRRAEPGTNDGGIAPGARCLDGTRAGSRAFTLIELMVVVAVMGVILGMGIPAIYSALHKDPMTQAVSDLVDACQGSLDHQGARSLAILNGKTMELRIYPQLRRIEVSSAGDSSPVAAAKPAADSPDGDSKAAPSGGFSSQISDHLYFKMLDVNFVDRRDADVAIVHFYPNGTCDELNIILVSDSGEARRITLDIMTALPQVASYE